MHYYLINKSKSYYHGSEIRKFLLGSGRGWPADRRTLQGEKIMHLVWVMTEMRTIVKLTPVCMLRTAFSLV